MYSSPGAWTENDSWTARPNILSPPFNRMRRFFDEGGAFIAAIVSNAAIGVGLTAPAQEVRTPAMIKWFFSALMISVALIARS